MNENENERTKPGEEGTSTVLADGRTVDVLRNGTVQVYLPGMQNAYEFPLPEGMPGRAFLAAPVTVLADSEPLPARLKMVVTVEAVKPAGGRLFCEQDLTDLCEHVRKTLETQDGDRVVINGLGVELFVTRTEVAR